ncbi:unknown [Prevotella sp. CAG:5226]|nr:unknown [Prevotella sp. CAG:5226]
MPTINIFINYRIKIIGFAYNILSERFIMLNLRFFTYTLFIALIHISFKFFDNQRIV